uniref:Uncharacterized protein n=1 Tax=viral metagenome TaxID=1070528 RepID=A0A6C0LJW6_9ZZZZ
MSFLNSSLKYIGISWVSYIILRKGYFLFKQKNINNIDMLYDAVYWVSYLQIKANQFQEMLMNISFVKEIKTYFNDKEETAIEFVKDYEVIDNCLMQKLNAITNDDVVFIKSLVRFVDTDEVDFIKVFQPLNKVNYVRILAKEEGQALFLLDVSTVKFMLLEIVLNEEDKFKIDLDAEKENYYLVNNVIDKKVLGYLLNSQHNKNLSDTEYDEKIIRINILDNNVQSHSIEFDKKIVIRKDGYEII